MSNNNYNILDITNIENNINQTDGYNMHKTLNIAHAHTHTHK